MNPREFVAQWLRVRGQTRCHAGDQQGHARQYLGDAVMQLQADRLSLDKEAHWGCPAPWNLERNLERRATEVARGRHILKKGRGSTKYLGSL